MRFGSAFFSLTALVITMYWRDHQEYMTLRRLEVAVQKHTREMHIRAWNAQTGLGKAQTKE